MIDTGKLVESLIEKRKEYCKQYYPKYFPQKGFMCCKRNENREYIYCPMAYYGEIYNGCTIDLDAPDKCRISDFIACLKSQGY